MSRKWYFGDTPEEYSEHLHAPVRMESATVTVQFLASDGYRLRSVTGNGYACPVCHAAWQPYRMPTDEVPLCDGVFVWNDCDDADRAEQHYPPADFKKWGHANLG